jgi:signal transduction histidine kinase/ligand-binding sensor domain-containing protein
VRTHICKISTIFLFLIILTGIPDFVSSQSFKMIQYRVQQGLPSDFIKSISQDSTGFIWIGTDEGLSLYNGYEFRTFPNSIPSQYVKNVLRTSRNKMLAVTDLGIIEIENQSNDIKFRDILKGSRSPSDTSAWYPKSIYEDKNGTLWISEPQSILKFANGKFTRYPFGLADNSISFVRSFQFAETAKGRLIITSINGNIFYYDRGSDKIVPLYSDRNLREINHIVRFKDEMLIASASGLYSLNHPDEPHPAVKPVYHTTNLSHLLHINDSTVLACAFTGNLYSFIYQNGKFDTKIISANNPPIHQVFQSRDGNIWLSTEKGVIFLQQMTFNRVESPLNFLFVEAISPDIENNRVYFSSKENIWSYDIIKKQVSEILFDNYGYFLSMEKVRDGLWVSNTSRIEFFRNDKRVFEKNFNLEGRSIFDTNSDPDGNCWFTQEGFVGVRKISPDFSIQKFGPNEGIIYEPTVVRVSENGIYVGTYDPRHYLLFKKTGTDKFVDISVPLPFSVPSDLRIDDISFSDSIIWLASTSGLLKIVNGNISRVKLYEENITHMHVKSVEAMDHSPFVLFCNSLGLFQMNYLNNEISFYDENSGLPSNVINARGIEIDKSNRIWLGTADGLAYASNEIFNEGYTLKPVLLSIESNNLQYPVAGEKLVFSSRSYVNLKFSVLQFPANSIQYRYRILPLMQEWSIPIKNQSISFPQMRGGDYAVEIKAKKEGSFLWSDPLVIHFGVENEFYQKWWFVILIILAAVVLILTSFYLTSKVLKERQNILEQLVRDRTRDLEEANNNLAERNKELDQFVYSASHDMSAPLKSLLGLINITKLEIGNEQFNHLFLMMENSIKKLERFIKDVTDFSRNTRLRVTYETITLKKVINEIIENLVHADQTGRIRFLVNIKDDQTINTDLTRFRIIMNNLISNAIKFQRLDEKAPYVQVNIDENDDHYVISVEDNGMGISTEHHKKIFDMFFRVSAVSEGSGLGLYILNETVQKLHGSVSVKSEPAKGAIFTVVLPKH